MFLCPQDLCPQDLCLPEMPLFLVDNPAPEGLAELSPALQRWEKSQPMSQVPEGTTEFSPVLSGAGDAAQPWLFLEFLKGLSGAEGRGRNRVRRCRVHKGLRPA